MKKRNTFKVTTIKRPDVTFAFDYKPQGIRELQETVHYKNKKSRCLYAQALEAASESHREAPKNSKRATARMLALDLTA
jgi:hypothetical protein